MNVAAGGHERSVAMLVAPDDPGRWDCGLHAVLIATGYKLEDFDL